MQPAAGPVELKLVFVGDSSCGKTCCIVAHTQGRFVDAQPPSAFDVSASEVRVDGEHAVALSMWDTSGDAEFDRLRPLSYDAADCVVVVFSVVEPLSLASARARWCPEAAHFCPAVPIVLVGTKVDLRADRDTIGRLDARGVDPVSPEQGAKAAKELGALGYFECSAKTFAGVSATFEGTARTTLERRRDEKLRAGAREATGGCGCAVS